VKALLDTNILAELVKPNGNPAVRAALAEIPTPNVFLSVLTVGEIVKGIALLVSGPKKKHLTKWLAGIESDYGERVLPLDVETARIWGELTARAQKKGIAIPPADGLLAATALRHGLHVMTRNTKHFEASGALVVDPWQGNG
jgi:predicted nucleic acid-binding protein